MQEEGQDGPGSTHQWQRTLELAGLYHTGLPNHLPPHHFMGSEADIMVPVTSGVQMAACLSRYVCVCVCDLRCAAIMVPVTSGMQMAACLNRHVLHWIAVCMRFWMSVWKVKDNPSRCYYPCSCCSSLVCAHYSVKLFLSTAMCIWCLLQQYQLGDCAAMILQ